MRLTRDGYNSLVNKVNDLKLEKEEVLKRLEAARILGDLKENAEYNEAISRLTEINDEIEKNIFISSSANIIDHFINSDYVDFGAYVTVEKDGKQETYQIVSDIEANYDKGKLSENSPFGKSLLNRKVNDIVHFNTPQTKRTYKIISIKYL